jgi:TrmH family RNA methyltransferase
MLSKATVKFVKSLQVKKYRKQEQCFLVEGTKSVRELLASDFEVVTLVATERFLSEVKVLPHVNVLEASERELESLGEFQTNNAALAVARLKPNLPVTVGLREYGLVLDDIRDPGNLGTIIRTADWYGINKIIASLETADFYSPKVISATMGSFTRTHIFYTDLTTFLLGTQHTVYGAYLEGDDVHDVNFAPGGLIIVGSESHGITPALQNSVTQKITIPRYGMAESLNAAIATAVICDNLRRKKQ